MIVEITMEGVCVECCAVLRRGADQAVSGVVLERRVMWCCVGEKGDA